MSDGRSGMHLHQFQDARRLSLDPSSQQLYQQRDLSGGLHAESPSSTMMGVTSHFNDFNFTYSTLSDQAVMVPMPDSHHPDPFSQHQAMASVMSSVPPSHSMNAMAGMPGQPFITESNPKRGSIDITDDSAHDKTSPASNSLEDPNADEFGMSSQGRGDGTDMGGKAKDDAASAPPAWSELKTKAGKDRKRLPLACIACRRKKIRCSGEKPACKHCLRSRIPCVYKVTTRKAAPRTDYMAMLDKRLKRMEERIIKILPKSEQDTVSAIPRAVVKPAIPGTGTLTSTKSTSKKRNADEAFGPDLEAWAKAPRPKMPDDDIGSPETREAEENRLLREGIDALPPKEIQEHLAEVFFDNVYGQAYHLLHKPSYMRKLKNDALPPVLVLSVCAIAARFTGNPKLNLSGKQCMRGEEWASHARDICTKRYDWPNITVLTCLLILGLHEFGTCHGGRSWALGGQAIRMAFALHLHKDLEYDPRSRNRNIKLSFIDREIRRRIMWACFLMDRFNSSGTDRPMFIREETMKIPLPVSERYFQFDMPAETEYLDGRPSNHALPVEGQMKEPRDNMGVSAYTIRSIAIWGRIIIYLNQGGKEQDAYPMWSGESEYAKLVRDAEELLRTLPGSIQYSRKNLDVHRTENTASHLVFLHMAIQQNLLFLNQAAVSYSQDRVGEEAPKDFVPQSSARTYAAANRISDLIRDAEDTQCNISTPFAGYCAFSSTAIHITGIFSGNPAMRATAEANCGVNVKFLRKMMKYWGMFHWMVENIRTQYRQALDASHSLGPTNGSTASSPILQYSDWFNQYPHGVSDTDFMDPAMYRKKEKGEDGVLESKPELQSVEEFFATVGPTQNAESQDNSRVTASKRKTASKKPTTTVTNKTDQQQPGQSPGGRSVSSQMAGQQQPQPQQQQQHLHRQQSVESQRRYSAPLVGQTNSPSAFNQLAVQQPQTPSYSIMSPMSPANVQQFSRPTPQAGFFSTDMLPMNMGQQADNMMHPIDRHLSYGGFPIESGGVAGSQNMMNGVAGWDGMSANTTQANGQAHNQQDVKNNVMNASHPHVQGQLDALNQLGSQDLTSPGWFVPMEGNQDMGLGGGMDTFTGLYGGASGMTIANHHSL